MAQVAPSKQADKTPEEIYRLHQVEQMIIQFMRMDKDKNGKVSKKELQNYYVKCGDDAKQVESWMTKFDADNDGNVTLAEFARRIGLPISDLEKERNVRLSEEKEKIEPIPDIEVIACTMTRGKAKEIIEKFKTLVTTHSPADQGGMSKVTSELKVFLDTTYGRIWQCICLTGAYWMNFSHEPFASVQFRYNNNGKDYVCLAWRTHRV